MLTRVSPREYDRLFIGAAWVVPTGSKRIPVVNPATEEPLGSVPVASVEDVELAVRAARVAFPTWALSSMVERAAVLERIAAGLEARVDEIASVVSQEVGT